MILPPRPILPWNAGDLTDAEDFEESEGGTIPAASSFSGTKGFVNGIIGSNGSCKRLSSK